MLKVITVPNKILREKTMPLKKEEFNSPKLKEIIEEMKKTMQAENGIGLSANQVGFNKSFFIAFFNKKIYAFFNPEIVKESRKKIISQEGCLSIPGTIAFLPRSKSIILKAKKIDGREIEMKLFGLPAIICQHEIDHLNGILITDKAKKIIDIKKGDEVLL